MSNHIDTERAQKIALDRGNSPGQKPLPAMVVVRCIRIVGGWHVDLRPAFPGERVERRVVVSLTGDILVDETSWLR